MGIDTGVRDAVAAGLIEGPQLLVAINMLSETSGHADFHLPSGIDPPRWSADPSSTPSMPPGGAPGN